MCGQPPPSRLRRLSSGTRATKVKSEKKVLLIGLDSAEPSLVHKWAAEGRLPHLARLMEEGSTASLQSAAAEFPDEVWPSIYTSRNSAQLGKYYYIQPKAGSSELELIDDAPKHGRQFWEIASSAGARCAVVDAPKTGLGPPLNGMQLANWGAHATRCDTASHPPDLVDRVIAKHGRYPLHSCDAHGLKPEEYRELRSQLLDGVALRERLLTDLIASEPWDLFFGSFAETHCAGHQFWHLQDPLHPRYDPEDRSGLRNALRDVYQAADKAVGSLVAVTGPGTNVLVFSGHGMRAQYHGRDLVPALLEFWGMSQGQNAEPHSAPEREVTLKKTFLRTLKDNVPIQWQYAVKKMLPSKIENMMVCRVMGAEKLDTSARAFYVPNNDLTAAIRINLRGRDPQGLVGPGREYDELCDWLTTRFTELVNPATGGSAVDRVSRIHDSYQGEHLDRLPDLTALWSQEAPIDALYSPGYGTVVGSHNDLRTGGHASQGFFIMRSADGAGFDRPEGNAKDVAPTVLSLLGVEIPEEMEGRSLVGVGARVG